MKWKHDQNRKIPYLNKISDFISSHHTHFCWIIGKHFLNLHYHHPRHVQFFHVCESIPEFKCSITTDPVSLPVKPNIILYNFPKATAFTISSSSKMLSSPAPEIHGSLGFWTNGCGVKWLDVAWCGPKTWILYHTNIYIVLPTKNLDLSWTVPHQKIFESLPWVAHCTWSDHLPKLNFLGMQTPANQLG